MRCGYVILTWYGNAPPSTSNSFQTLVPIGNAQSSIALVSIFMPLGRSSHRFAVAPSFHTGQRGVNAITPSYTPYGPDGKAMAPVLLDAQKYLLILDQIKTVAKCSPEDPPNKCEW